MISMAAVGGAGAAAAYYTKDNYYTDRDASETSAWAGAGAVDLGLAGEVAGGVFKAVLEGQLPDGSVIAAGRNGVRQPGLDLTFSAPKSVSILAYVAGDSRLLDANLAAVKETLSWAERNLAETRVSKDGKQIVEKTGKLVIGLFQHDTNRNLDPQAHVHAVIANATRATDGTWRALHNGKLWENNALLGTIYHAALREKVEALGYGVVPIGKYGTFEIAGVDRKTIEAFSTRRAEILAAADAKLDHQSPQGLRAVTLRTRAEKEPVADRGDLRNEWRDRAERRGVDLRGVVEGSRTTSPTSRWEQLTTGIERGVDRIRTVVEHVVARATERFAGEKTDVDPFLPRSAGKLDAKELGAAVAVASALRHLSQREAAFDVHSVYRSALELGLPVTIGGVEQAVNALREQGRLIPGSEGREGRLTTPEALATERAILAGALRDRGASPAIVANLEDAGRRVQAAAEARSGITLNDGQESAGRLILGSHDRVVNIQGVAGAGKSSVLGAVADVAREEGRNVLALGPQNVLVQDLAASSGIEAMTVAKFIGRHKLLLDPKTFTERVDLAKAMFKNGVVVVDEASMVSNVQMRTLVELANKLDFKLALVGDTRQLGAVDAGKPFEVLQRGDVPTALMTENLRARTEELKLAAKLANDGRPVAAFRQLGDTVIEAPGRIVEEAVARWIGAPVEQRDQTILLSSGRASRDGLNAGVQAALLAEGRIGGANTTLAVVENANLSREQERYAVNYEVGQVITFARGIPSQAIAAGRGNITGVDPARGEVEITRPDGKKDILRPGQLAKNRVDNSIQLGREKLLKVHEGDRIRWTANDPERGLFNAGKARITSITTSAVTFETAAGIITTLDRSDPQLARLDLGYAMNAHGNQGVTADRAIGVIDSRETNLTNATLFLVQITRARHGIDLIVNSYERVAGAIGRNNGEKSSALETIGGLGGRPSASPSIGAPDRPTSREAAENATAGRNQPALPAEPAKAPTHAPVLERTPARAPDHGL